MPKDDAKASELFATSCGAGSSTLGGVACYVNEHVYRKSGAHIDSAAMRSVVSTMQGQCDQGVARACTFMGVATLALGNRSQGQAAVEKGCQMKDAWACDLRKRLR